MKGIFAVSSLYMVQVTVIDYMMKVLAKERYAAMYPDDPQAAMRAFASFMGYFGQTTNSISFLFSFFGTGIEDWTLFGCHCYHCPGALSFLLVYSSFQTVLVSCFLMQGS